MAELLARGPIAPAAPVAEMSGWALSARRSEAALRLTDCSPMSKVLVRAAARGRTADLLGVEHRRATRDAQGVLVVGSAPGEWLLLAHPGEGGDLAGRVKAELHGDELVTVIDVTHGRALARLQGRDAAALLSKLCTVNLADGVTPRGAAFRSLVASVATIVVRDDRDGGPGYLLACERDFGQFLWDALLDAGHEFSIDIDGYR